MCDETSVGVVNEKRRYCRVLLLNCITDSISLNVTVSDATPSYCTGPLEKHFKLFELRCFILFWPRFEWPKLPSPQSKFNMTKENVCVYGTFQVLKPENNSYYNAVHITIFEIIFRT